MTLVDVPLRAPEKRRLHKKENDILLTDRQMLTSLVLRTPTVHHSSPHGMARLLALLQLTNSRTDSAQQGGIERRRVPPLSFPQLPYDIMAVPCTESADR